MYTYITPNRIIMVNRKQHWFSWRRRAPLSWREIGKSNFRTMIWQATWPGHETGNAKEEGKKGRKHNTNIPSPEQANPERVREKKKRTDDVPNTDQRRHTHTYTHTHTGKTIFSTGSWTTIELYIEYPILGQNQVEVAGTFRPDAPRRSGHWCDRSWRLDGRRLG